MFPTAQTARPASGAPRQGSRRTLRARLADAAGLVATPLRPSHYLALVNPLWATHAPQARVERVWDETAEARTLTLRPGRGWRGHRAGQWVRVGVSIDGLYRTRPYSIASAPAAADGCIAITVTALAGGEVSPFLVRRLQPGAYVTLSAAHGEFVLPDTAGLRPLFITAGSGITPVMSMLRSAVLRGRMPDTVHLHYAPQARAVIFGDELRRMADVQAAYRLHLTTTRAEGSANDGPRHFDAAHLAARCPDWPTREVWACGPPPLLDAVAAHWQRAGLADRLHVERFHAPLAALPADVTGGTVRFAASGRTVEADGRTPLLQIAERAGLRPPHGCRMGICHTCDATLVSGCVRDLRSGALHQAGRTVQVCVCAAAGDVELAL